MDFKVKDDLINKHKREFLDYARYNGRILLRQKLRTPAGEWIEYMENETPFSTRTCQKYMRISSFWHLLPDKKDFTIDEAFDYLIDLEKND